jgi:ribosomal protein S18 acetylase RimI-like enzyme
VRAGETAGDHVARHGDSRVSVRIARDIDGVDWTAVRTDLLADDFDNGRVPVALERSFAASQHVAMAWASDRVVGTARLLSDGVCNAYLVDVWTLSSHRRQGVASAMVRDLMAQVPGQHIALQTDDAQAFYETLGFRTQPELYSVIVGTWLDNEANRA